MFYRVMTTLFAIAFAAVPIFGEVETQEVKYEHAGAELEGYLAMDTAAESHKGAVLLVHAWWGLDDYTKGRAKQLAEMGYVAFALDMYGKGKLTDDSEQAGAWAGALYSDRALHRARANAGLDTFRRAAKLEADAPVVAIGYCFGGTTVVELAYHNPKGLAGVVSFHGNPKPAAKDDQVAAKILIAHGDADPLVSDEDLDKVTDSLDAKKVDWQLIRYAGAKHAFTDPNADSYGLPPVAYDEKADKRSWAHMLVFFDEAFSSEES